MSLDRELNNLKQKYQQLLRADSVLTKQNLIFQIRAISQIINQIVQGSPVKNGYQMRQYVRDVLNACIKIQTSLNPSSDSMSIPILVEGSHPEAVQYAVQSFARKSLEYNVPNKQVDPNEVAKIVADMERNLILMKNIQKLVQISGENYNVIDDNIDMAIKGVDQVNVELDQAKEIAHRTFLAELRASVYGTLALVGYAFLGLPGMIFGLFTGWKIF